MSLFERAIALGGSCDTERNLTKMALRLIFGSTQADTKLYWAICWLKHARSYPPTLAFVLQLLDAAAASADQSEALSAAHDLIFSETIQRDVGNELQRVLILAHMIKDWVQHGAAVDAILSRGAALMDNVIRSGEKLAHEVRAALVQSAWLVIGRDEADVRLGVVKPKNTVFRLQDCVTIIVRCGNGFKGNYPNVVAARVHMVRRLCSIARSFYKADAADVVSLNMVVSLLLIFRTNGDPIDAFCLLKCCIESISTAFLAILGLDLDQVPAATTNSLLHCANAGCTNLDGESELSLMTYPIDQDKRVCSDHCRRAVLK